MEDANLNKIIEEKTLETVKKYLASSAFTLHKITDTPTDALQVTNRRYVTMNGTTANRPMTSVIGQRYFDTTLNRPVWIGNGYAWVDADGNAA